MISKVILFVCTTCGQRYWERIEKPVYVAKQFMCTHCRTLLIQLPELYVEEVKP